MASWAVWMLLDPAGWISGAIDPCPFHAISADTFHGHTGYYQPLIALASSQEVNYEKMTTNVKIKIIGELLGSADRDLADLAVDTHCCQDAALTLDHEFH